MTHEHSQPALDFLILAEGIIQKIRTTQVDQLQRASEICSTSILGGGLVHLFGTGHSRMMIEEMFPRHGSFPGFHPIVELSLTYHTNVVGSNGQRQAMYLEHIEGFAKIILKNFKVGLPDSFLIFSHSGVNEVVVDMALEVKKRDLPVMAVVSMDHCNASPARHSSGKKLIDIADVVIDNCTPKGDAMVTVPDLPYPVGPGSTIGGAVVVNALKCLIADNLTRNGQPPYVLTSAIHVGEKASAEMFDRCYDDYRGKIKRVYDSE
jgi:uncharacterized phosphosugar-binding protein